MRSVLARALKVLRDYDGLTHNKVEDLASDSETDDDYYEVHTDDNSKKDAEKEKERIPFHIYKRKDSYIWQAKSKKSGRTPLHNIVSEKPEPKHDEALARSPQKAFKIFIIDRLITIITECAN